MATENLKELIGSMCASVFKHRDEQAKRELFHGLVMVLRREEARVRFMAIRKAKPGKAGLVFVEGSINRKSYLQEGEIVKKAAENAGLVLIDHEELNKDGWTGHGWTVRMEAKHEPS